MKALIITASILILFYIGYRTYRMLTLAENLGQKIEQGAVILDVRTKGEFETGHIDGAINIALSKLATEAIPLEKNTVIITVCSHGLRSVKAVERLKDRGYKNTYNGGAWFDLEKVIQNK